MSNNIVRREKQREYMKTYYANNKHKWVESHSSEEVKAKRREVAKKHYHRNKNKSGFREYKHKHKYRYGFLKAHSKRRWGVYPTLTYEEFVFLVNQGCLYCTLQIVGTSGYSLDRINNSRYYDSDNVVPCCHTCNTAKNDMSVSEFVKWIKTVYENISRWEDSFISDNQRLPNYVLNQNSGVQIEMDLNFSKLESGWV